MHYNIPGPELIQRWADAVPDGFLFCPKFPQRISHRSAIDLPLPMTDLFLEAVYGLGDHLGPSFLQLPPWYGPQHGGIDRLHKFLTDLPSDFDVTVEFRHEAWFADETVKNEAFGMLETIGAGAVIVDTVGRRDVCHMRLTSDTALIRFTCNNLHSTDYPRCDAWAERLGQWVRGGLKKVYLLLHQPDEHLCADLAIYLAPLLNSIPGIEVAPPRLYAGRQQELF